MRARTARVSLDSVEADTILAGALRILEARAHYGNALTSPAAVRDYLKLAIASRGRAPVPRADCLHHPALANVRRTPRAKPVRGTVASGRHLTA